MSDVLLIMTSNLFSSLLHSHASFTLMCAAPSVTYGARTSRIRSQGKPANQVLAITSPTPFFPSLVGAALISPVKKLQKIEQYIMI